MWLVWQERTAGAIWAIAGKNIEERLLMAERITVRLLIEFVNSSSALLNLIGAEALYALCSGPLGQHDNVAYGGGVPALIYLIRRPPPDGVPVIAGRPVCNTRSHRRSYFTNIYRVIFVGRSIFISAEFCATSPVAPNASDAAGSGLVN